MAIVRSLRGAGLMRGAALALCLTLAGCGGVDGVEFNGAIFNAIGLGGSDAKDKDPIVAPRAGLVLPPQRDVLPQPQSEASVDPSFPVDPEVRKRQQVASKDQQQTDFCTAELKRKMALRDHTPTYGPQGPCDPSILRMIGGSGSLQSMQTGEAQPSPTKR